MVARAIAAARPDALIACSHTLEPRRINLSDDLLELLNGAGVPVLAYLATGYGFRPIEPSVATSTASQFPVVADQFTVAQFGGWGQAGKDVFTTDTGIYYQALATAQGK